MTAVNMFGSFDNTFATGIHPAFASVFDNPLLADRILPSISGRRGL
jgi:hypothetical protein